MDKNPELIQSGNIGEDGMQTSRAPAFLIHEFGGTTFACHCLEPLGRPTYGIFNPFFHSGGSCEGGVCGMGRLYAGLIRRTCAEPDFPAERNSDGSVSILIGGWSMGGLLSLEIAKALTGDRGVRIIGILMIDTMYPVGLRTERLETMDHLDGSSRPRNLSLSQQVMKESLRAIREWDPPIWTGNQAMQRPQISLLRAVEPLPANSDHAKIIDVYRHTRSLGWEKYDAHLFWQVVDVKGNHLELFSFQHIPEISTAIMKCFDTFENLVSVV